MITFMFITTSYLALLAHTAGLMPGRSLPLSVALALASVLTMMKPTVMMLHGSAFGLDEEARD